VQEEETRKAKEAKLRNDYVSADEAKARREAIRRESGLPTDSGK
jgi:type III secretory pathway component EscV